MILNVTEKAKLACAMTIPNPNPVACQGGKVLVQKAERGKKKFTRFVMFHPSTLPVLYCCSGLAHEEN